MVAAAGDGTAATGLRRRWRCCAGALRRRCGWEEVGAVDRGGGVVAGVVLLVLLLWASWVWLGRAGARARGVVVVVDVVEDVD